MSHTAAANYSWFCISKIASCPYQSSVRWIVGDGYLRTLEHKCALSSLCNANSAHGSQADPRQVEGWRWGRPVLDNPTWCPLRYFPFGDMHVEGGSDKSVPKYPQLTTTWHNYLRLTIGTTRSESKRDYRLSLIVRCGWLVTVVHVVFPFKQERSDCSARSDCSCVRNSPS